VFTVTYQSTMGGPLALTVGSPFALQYTYTSTERSATFSLSSILTAGSAPMDTATLRSVCSFPSIYDTNAVYLGNFDFLLRRNLGAFQFLSVWNEAVEESVRGASVNNINCLFIAAQQSGVTAATLQSQISALIAAADDSYTPIFKAVTPVFIPLSVAAQVSSSYDFSAVESEISQLITKNYGPTSAFAQRGQSMPLYKDVWNLLYNNVPALQATYADFQVTIASPTATLLPEQWRYVDLTSLTITVTQATFQNGGWAQ